MTDDLGPDADPATCSMGTSRPACSRRCSARRCATIPGRCAHCGDMHPIGELRAYVRAPGTTFDAQPATGSSSQVVQTPTATYVDAGGRPTCASSGVDGGSTTSSGARRHVQRHVSPVVERRHERQASLADDLEPRVLRRDRRPPVAPRALRPGRGRRADGARSRHVGLGQPGMPLWVQRRKRSTCASGHTRSQGIVPSARRSRMASAFSLTSSYDQRSNANSIDSRSLSRNSGLMSVSKLTGSSASVVRSLRSCRNLVAVDRGRFHCRPRPRPRQALIVPAPGRRHANRLTNVERGLGDLAPAVVDRERVASVRHLHDLRHAGVALSAA